MSNDGIGNPLPDLGADIYNSGGVGDLGAWWGNKSGWDVATENPGQTVTKSETDSGYTVSKQDQRPQQQSQSQSTALTTTSKEPQDEVIHTEQSGSSGSSVPIGLIIAVGIGVAAWLWLSSRSKRRQLAELDAIELAHHPALADPDDTTEHVTIAEYDDEEEE